MNRHRLVVMGYAALCAVAVLAQSVMAEESPSPQPIPANSGKNERSDAPGELKVNLPVPPPGSDEAKYYAILEELGQGDHRNVPLLLEICAKHKGVNSFVRMSPAMLAAYKRNYLVCQQPQRSTMALAAVTAMRHFPTPENAQKVRLAIEEWGFGIDRLGLKPGEIMFVQEHTGNTPLKLPIVKERILANPKVLASRHAAEPLVKSVVKPEVKPRVKRRRKLIQRDSAIVDIRPAPTKNVRQSK